MLSTLLNKTTFSLFPSIDDLLRDTDSELENEVETKKKRPAKKRRGGEAWLKEGQEDHIVDFLDPNAAKKVLGEHLFFLKILSRLVIISITVIILQIFFTVIIVVIFCYI